MSSDLVITPTAPKIAGLPVYKAHERARYRNMLVYGDSGIGKTQLLGSADEVPELRKVLLVDAEGGSMTLEHSYPNVDIVRVKSWKQTVDVVDFLEHTQHDYCTVCFDSLTELQKYNMYAILRDPKRDAEKYDEDLASWQDWGKNLEQMRRFVRRVRDLPMHSLFSALTSEDKDPKTGKIFLKPGFPGKLRNEVAAFLDIVVYMYMKEVPDPQDAAQSIQKRMLLTGATDKHIAKDRSNKLPMVLPDPTMKRIYELTETAKETANV